MEAEATAAETDDLAMEAEALMEETTALAEAGWRGKRRKKEEGRDVSRERTKEEGKRRGEESRGREGRENEPDPEAALAETLET